MQKTRIISFLISISLLFIFFQNGFSINNSRNGLIPDSLDINDGPYIFVEESKLIEKLIVKGKVVSKEYPLSSMETVFFPDKAIYTDVKKIAVIADIHGQYDVAIELLLNNEIIDKNLRWKFGNGHLVILGDIFDRGDKVTEMLWFVFHLEKQAMKKGGKVHFLTGNHEYMVLHDDIRYVHEKYKISVDLLNMPYYKLYSDDTVLGRWLRSKNVVIKINDILFNHAGISEEFIAEGFNLSDINAFMRNAVNVSKEKKKSDPIYRKYFGSSGPIWYRGYFKENMTQEKFDILLNLLRVNYIVVGHSTQKEIKTLFKNKLFAVDSGIKYGKSGQILMINRSRFYKCSIDGKKERFDKYSN